MKIFALTSVVALSLVACGGGGGGASGGTAAGGTNSGGTATFVTANATDSAYFSNSYELAYAGYIKNETSTTGAGGRTQYTLQSGTYQPESSRTVFQAAYINSKSAPFLFDRYVGFSYKNTSSGYTASAVGSDDLVGISSIQSIDLSGKKFSELLTSSALTAGATAVDGTFPSGAVAYGGQITSLQDMYMFTNGGTVYSGVLNSSTFYKTFNTAEKAICVGTNASLYFTSATEAKLGSTTTQTGGGCAIDTSKAMKTVTVTSRSVTDVVVIFEFGNETVDVTDYESTFFSYQGTMPLKFAILAENFLATGTDPATAVRKGYFFQKGSTGTRLNPDGLRLNKEALNAVLTVKGQPAI